MGLTGKLFSIPLEGMHSVFKNTYNTYILEGTFHYPFTTSLSAFSRLGNDNLGIATTKVKVSNSLLFNSESRIITG